jgi:hypothetical protein
VDIEEAAVVVIVDMEVIVEVSQDDVVPEIYVAGSESTLWGVATEADELLVLVS